MSRTKPVSFRIPSKYICFLDALAYDNQTNRTGVLITLLDIWMDGYLKQKQPPVTPTAAPRRWDPD
jgi:hypothetical protein